MNRFRLLLLFTVATTNIGCWRKSEPIDNTEPPPAVDSEASDGNVDPIDAVEDNGPTTNQELAPVDVPNNNPPAPPDSNDVKHLRDMASGDPRTLASASDYFITEYDDNGVAIYYEHLNNDDAEVRRGAIYGLFAQFDRNDEQMLTTLQNALDDDDPIVRRVALKVMSLPNYPRQRFLDSIDRIVKHLDDTHEPDAATRGQVARMLTIHTTRSAAALPALNEALRSDPDVNVRLACLRAISQIAQTADEALLPPQQALKSDPDPRVRRAAASRLGNYGPKAAPAVDTLIIALADQGVPDRAADDPLHGTDEPVCIAAADALARIGPAAIDPLINSLTSEDRDIRLLTMRALGDIRPAATAAVDPLQAIADSADPGEANAAKAALIRIDEN